MIWKPVRIIDRYYVIEGSEQIAAYLTDAKVSPPFIAAPITLANGVILRNFGYKTPSPMRLDYRWTLRRGRTPRWYQEETADFLTQIKRGYCLNAMRTGKTNSALSSADYLMQQKVVRKALISAPLSTLELVWGDSIWYDNPHRKFAVLHGSRKRRKELLAQDVDFYIINHDGVELIEKEIRERTDIDMVIIDEISELKNKDTDKWKAHKRVIRPDMWAWGLTGTPTPKAPSDAYGPVQLITPENFNGSFTRLKETTMIQVSPYKWVPRMGWEDVVYSILKPAIRFPRSVNTSMEPTLIERKAELSTEQKKHYLDLIREQKTWVRNNQVTAVNAGVMVSKLVQVACGVVYGVDGSTMELDFGPRLRVLEELIEENDEKVLVFVPFTGVLDALARKLGARWSVETVDGRVSAGARNKIFRAFQTSKDPHVLVVHPETMQHGLDLTAASLAIWYAPWRKSNEQANARIDGACQKVKIDIARIFATIEEREAYRAIDGEISMQQVILNMAEGKL